MKENEVRDQVINSCGEYLRMSQDRFFKSFGRHNAEKKRELCRTLRDSARYEDFVIFGRKLNKAVDFLNDNNHEKTALRKPLENHESVMRGVALSKVG